MVNISISTAATILKNEQDNIQGLNFEGKIPAAARAGRKERDISESAGNLVEANTALIM